MWMWCVCANVICFSIDTFHIIRYVHSDFTIESLDDLIVNKIFYTFGKLFRSANYNTQDGPVWPERGREPILPVCVCACVCIQRLDEMTKCNSWITYSIFVSQDQIAGSIKRCDLRGSHSIVGDNWKIRQFTVTIVDISLYLTNIIAWRWRANNHTNHIYSNEKKRDSVCQTICSCDSYYPM